MNNYKKTVKRPFQLITSEFVFTLSLPESNLESINVAVPFERLKPNFSKLNSRFFLSFELSALGSEGVKNMDIRTWFCLCFWHQLGRL